MYGVDVVSSRDSQADPWFTHGGFNPEDAVGPPPVSISFSGTPVTGEPFGKFMLAFGIQCSHSVLAMHLFTDD